MTASVPITSLLRLLYFIPAYSSIPCLSLSFVCPLLLFFFFLSSCMQFLYVLHFFSSVSSLSACPYFHSSHPPFFQFLLSSPPTCHLFTYQDPPARTGSTLRPQKCQLQNLIFQKYPVRSEAWLPASNPENFRTFAQSLPANSSKYRN